METAVKELSSIYSYPVNFYLAGDKFVCKQTPFYFSNDFYCNIHSFLKEAEDVKFNKKTGLFLTNLLSSVEIFKDKELPANTENLSYIETPISHPLLWVVSLSGTPPFKKLALYPKKDFNESDKIKFVFNEDNTVTVESQEGTILTHNDTVGTNSLFFTNKETPIPATQKFDYLLSDQSIILYKYGSNYGITVRKGSNNIYELSSSIPNRNIPTPQDIILNFLSFKNETYEFDTVENSYLVRYVSSPLISQKDITPTEDSAKEAYNQNYMSLFPVENPIIENEVATYDLHIHGLKNYQTPEYNYSKGAKYIPSSSSIRRLYRNIFSGTNQLKGSENVYLGYTTNTFEKVFAPDTYTSFRYPPVSEKVFLPFSGLIEDGSYAGEVPYTSDRMYVKQINYEETIPGQPQPESIKRQNGTWLCSWLNEGPFGPRWLDRYYNSAYYTIEQALSATTMVYNKKLNPNVDYEVWDEPTTMILDPGVQYSYFRSGKETSKEFLKFLNYDFNKPLGAKVLDIQTYPASATYLVDQSNYKNNGLLYNNKSENLKNSYIQLDGTNHAVFPAKNILLEQNYLTLSLWLNVNDWSNINGDQIIGNYYESGFGLINDSAITAPIFTVIDSTSGIFYNLNYKMIQVDNISLPTVANAQNYFVQRLSDYSYWIVDAYNRVLRKYTVEGKVLYETTVPDFRITYIDQIEIDSKENLYLFDVKRSRIAVVNTLGVAFSSIQIGSEYKRIEINLNNAIIPSYGNCSCIDNDNNLWEVVGGNLYKNRNIYANLGPMQQITCDTSNNLWLVHQKDKLTKFNINTDRFEFTKSIGTNSLIDDECFDFTNQFRFLNFIKAPKTGVECNPTNEKTQDLAIFIDDWDKQAYLLTDEGLLASKLNLNALFTTNLNEIQVQRSFKANGDFTGYQYLRKFGRSNKNLSWKFKIADINGQRSQLLSLSSNVQNLPDGWHNFVFNFDSEKGTAKFYIDTFLVNSVSFEKNRYQLYYDYRSSILLGASNIKNTTLNDLIKIDDAYKFVGLVGPIMMYSKSLTKGEIEQIYYSSEFSIPRGPLKWNVNIGERNYIEEIEHWFQMQLPSNKSKYFNINIHNLPANDEVKQAIETAIKNNIAKISPAYTSLYKINWL